MCKAKNYMTHYINDFTGYKLKIDSKKLNSGKYQVRFQTQGNTSKERYGYILANEGSTLKEVVTQIRGELNKLAQSDLYFHAHLYSLGKAKQPSNVFIFEH